MLRSMFTAISSLNLHQAFLDVIADNLANANTPGFKASRAVFQDQFAQVLSVGAAPGTDRGGINPTQIGLGARLGSVTPDFAQGMLQGTGRVLDLAIQGDGFFVLSDGTETYFTREGSLEIDADGYLVHGATGLRVQGWVAPLTSGSAGFIDTGQPVGDIQIPTDSTLARATSQVLMGGNLDSTTGVGGTFDVTMGVYDSLGVLHTVTVTFTKTADNNWSWSATSGATGNGTLVFGTDGQYVSGGGTITVPASGGAAATTINLDMSGMTQLATANSAAALNQDGLAAGSLTGFSVISATGEIYGSYSNGLQLRLGQIALATFVNPSGLLREGQNLFRQGLNTGDPAIGAAGSGGRGTIASGYLEASNVDLSREFTHMILAQRGFQAASRVITTSDEMLQELVNLKR